jgi:acetyl/propionyl-CoA carboxylase alpha subunit
MIAKLVIWGQDRAEAIARCRRALLDYRIVGTPTSIPFFLALFEDPHFLAGKYDTGFITADWLGEKLVPDAASIETAVVASAIVRFEADLARKPATSDGAVASAWKVQGWRAGQR